jgi:hypothetical protein
MYEYESPDGSRHLIDHNNLLDFEPLDFETTVDGSGIRVDRIVDQGTVKYPDEWMLYFPDGTRAHFLPESGTAGQYRVDKLWGPERIDTADAPWVEVAYDVGTNSRCILSITDRLGRQITFTNAGGRTTRIDLPSANGTVSYSFEYDGPLTLEPPDDPCCSPALDPVADLHLLRRVRLPRADSPVDPALDRTPILAYDYYTSPAAAENHGLLRRRYLPMEAHELTGQPPAPDPGSDPHVEYLYGHKMYRKMRHSSSIQDWVLGSFDALVVTEKRLHPEEGAPHVWTWDRTHDGLGNPVTVDAHDPDGNSSYYEYLTDSSPNWKDGLPSKILSYAGPKAGPRTLLSSETREYRIGYFYEDGYGLRQVQGIDVQKRTVSREGLSVVTHRLGFDDYGRPSDVIVESPGRGLYRRVRTTWSASPGPDDPWFLGGWSRRQMFDELGRAFATEDAAFSANGRLLDTWARVNADGSPAAGNIDIHTEHEYDVDTATGGYGWGLLKKTRVSGADGGHPYESAFDYQDDTYLARVQPLDAGDSIGTLLAPFYSTNRDVEKFTGLPLRTLDPNDEVPGSAGAPGHAGAEESTFAYDTTYSWDDLGRLTAVRPPGAAATTISYPSLWETRVEQCVSPSDCRGNLFRHDRLGRLVGEWASDKDGNLNGRVTEYDWANRVTRQSEWFSCAQPSSQPCDPTQQTLAWTAFDYDGRRGAGPPGPALEGHRAGRGGGHVHPRRPGAHGEGQRGWAGCGDPLDL